VVSRGIPWETAGEWTLDQSQQCNLILDTTIATYRVNPGPVVPAGVQLNYINTVRDNHNIGGGGGDLKHSGPNVTGTYRAEWGRLRVVIAGKDMTYYRGIPTQIKSWTINEPFGDASATIEFPQISIFEDTLQSFRKFADVEIQRVQRNGTTTVLWAGEIIEDYDTDDGGTGIECVGSFYEGDTFLKKPRFDNPLEDVGDQITGTIAGYVAFWGWNLATPDRTLTGTYRRDEGFFEPLVTSYLQGRLDELRKASGEAWTIECENRTPVLKQKNTTTQHYRVWAGGRGVKLNMRRDFLSEPTVIYGEGVDENANCHWRNTKYPNIHQDTAPPWPGEYLSLGSSGANQSTWETEMSKNGWGVSVDGSMSAGDVSILQQFQAQAGITVDGIVGPQTWAATFEPGENQGELFAYVHPLSYLSNVEPFLFNSIGAITGLNPDFNPRFFRRIERFENFGQGVQKNDAIVASVDMLSDNEYGYFGTIELSIDPEGGHRYQMRAGENIRVVGHRGQSVLFHIAQVDVSPEDGTVSLTVDSEARDLPNLVALQKRDEEARKDPGLKFRKYHRASSITEDRWPVWDCESGAGIIPYHAIQATLWNVIQIPMGRYGEVVATNINVPGNAAVGIFDRPLQAKDLQVLGRPDETDGFWDAFTEGLIIAWGESGQMAGYSPGTQSDEDAFTGVLRDTSTWTFYSTQTPWVWVAMWCDTTGYVQGRLYPGPVSGGVYPTNW
jgi:peptidoglycan hydrolase-like protein with peptidoglycan-binding domain